MTDETPEEEPEHDHRHAWLLIAEGRLRCLLCGEERDQ